MDFLQLLRDEAPRHKALFIFDEAMTSRLSYHGYGDKISIVPDLMTIGKWVGGGMSFGIFDPRLGKLEHAGTFNNNVMSMSAGIAGCTLLAEARIDELDSRGGTHAEGSGSAACRLWHPRMPSPTRHCQTA
jgi:glutamate-1-semialdehyde 2,1-aminomutase